MARDVRARNARWIATAAACWRGRPAQAAPSGPVSTGRKVRSAGPRGELRGQDARGCREPRGQDRTVRVRRVDAAVCNLTTSSPCACAAGVTE